MARPRREIITSEYYGEVIKVDGVCFIFDDVDFSKKPQEIDEEPPAFSNCDDCRYNETSETPTIPVIEETTSSGISSYGIESNFSECLKWIELEECSSRKEYVRYPGRWTGGYRGYWWEIRRAVKNLEEGPQTINMTYTIENRSKRDDPRFHSTGLMPMGEDAYWDTQPIDSPAVGNPVTGAEFLSEIALAFSYWKAAFEFAYSRKFGFKHELTINFIYAGDENLDPSITPGDFRFGQEAYDPSMMWLAHAAFPLPWSNIGDGKNCTYTHFGAWVPFAPDEYNKHSGDANSWSVAHSAAHEIGHNFGFKHNRHYKGVRVPPEFPFKSIVHPYTPSKNHTGSTLKDMWDGLGIVNSYEDIRAIHETYGLPIRYVPRCTWLCDEGASANTLEDILEIGNTVTIDGECYAFVGTHTGPSVSLPSCQSGEQVILRTATVDKISVDCGTCEADPAAMDALYIAQQGGDAALNKLLSESSSSKESVNVRGFDDDHLPPMLLASRCTTGENWCIPEYFLDHLDIGDTFELWFNESEKDCFTLIGDGVDGNSSYLDCDYVYDVGSFLYDLRGPYFTCEDCLGGISSEDSSEYQSSSLSSSNVST